MINAAIVGLGRHGRNIVSAVQGKSTRLRFTHGVVRRPDEAAPFAREHGLSISTDFAAVLADPSVQAVVLATPHSQHPEQVVAAAAAGRHVFCEKPLALTKADAARMIEACRRARVMLSVGTDKRFWPSMQELRRIVASGELGELLHVEAHNSNEVSRGFAGTWRDSEAESPAGGMTGTGIHSLDAMVSLAGPARWIDARLIARTSTPVPIDTVSVLIEFASGVSGTMATVRSTPFYWRVHAFGREGSAEALGRNQIVVRRSGAQPVARMLEPVDALRAEIDAFAGAVAGAAPWPVPAAELLATVAAFEGIVRSIETGTAVSIDDAYLRSNSRMSKLGPRSTT